MTFLILYGISEGMENGIEIIDQSLNHSTSLAGAEPIESKTPPPPQAPPATATPPAPKNKTISFQIPLSMAPVLADYIGIAHGLNEIQNVTEQDYMIFALNCAAGRLKQLVNS